MLRGFRPLLILSLLVMVGVAPPVAWAAGPGSSESSGPRETRPELALVVQDQVTLYAAPRESAPQQALLWQGDSLEIRGEKGDFLQVYDYRRERGGYVRAREIRVLKLDGASAPELLAVLRFLADLPGAESLGIAYGAAYLRALPGQPADGEVELALGRFAERLARRASGATGKRAEVANAQVEIARHLGLGFRSLPRNELGGRENQLCYDGDAFRRALQRPLTPAARADAALALTRLDCLSPDLLPGERGKQLQAFADLLDTVQADNRRDGRPLPPVWQNRLAIRRAGILASLAFHGTRQGEGMVARSQASDSQERAEAALASVIKGELMESDQAAWQEALTRVGATRWAALPGLESRALGGKGQLQLVVLPGEPGQRCISLQGGAVPGRAPQELVRRCTYGLVWTQSATLSPKGDRVALAVQPLEGWRELWLLHQTPGSANWTVQVLPPDTGEPDLGYVEWAGWIPGGDQFLVAREVRQGGRVRRSFELVRGDTLETEKRADQPGSLSTFYRWQDPLWKQGTLTLR